MKTRRTLIAAIVASLMLHGSALAYTNFQFNAVSEGRPLYDPNECEQTAAPTNTGGIGGGQGNVSDYQVEYIKDIIGIAKTLNLGRQGALIGLMTAWAEASMSDLGNNGLYDARYHPLDALSRPYAVPKDNMGNDHDSVGIFQQRAIDGNWAPVDPKTDLPGVVKWLMDVPYAAEAFFAMPAGKKAGTALIKVPNWQGMDPALAAQAVQGSAFGNGSNYRQYQAKAQSEVNQYYDAAPAIPLPAPLTGSGAPPPGSNLSQTGCSVNAGLTGNLAGCVNPFSKDKSAWGLARTDMGVDFIPRKVLPVYAICDGVIKEATTTSGWPGGGWISYKLTSGPLIGKCIYVAEQIVPTLSVGTPVKAGQQIATAYPVPVYTEWGWSQSPRLNHEPSTPYNGAADGTPMPGGKAFARFLRALGADTQMDPGPGPMFDGTPCP